VRGDAPAASGGAAASAAPDAARAARGGVLYERLDCAVCHDARRAAPGLQPRPLTGLAARYSASALAEFLAAPTPPMPAFELAASERADLAAFLLAAYP
jgi:mono/diheme cytochrome c family protein